MMKRFCNNTTNGFDKHYNEDKGNNANDDRPEKGREVSLTD